MLDRTEKDGALRNREVLYFSEMGMGLSLKMIAPIGYVYSNASQVHDSTLDCIIRQLTRLVDRTYDVPSLQKIHLLCLPTSFLFLTLI